MDDRVVQLKRLKKERKKAKRKHVAVWKTFGILFLLLAIIFSVATPVALLLDNAVVAVAGGTFWEVLQPDENAEYFTVDYTSDQERLNAGKELSYQLEAEGAVLLQNSGVLPFAQGTKIRTQSASDALKADLTKSGLTVVSAGEKADAVLLMLGSGTELTQEEKADLESAAKLKKNGVVKSIVVLFKDALFAEALQTEKYSVDAAMWVGDSKTQAVTDLLAGKVNPSGALTEAVVTGADGDYQYHEGCYRDFVTGSAEGYLYTDNVAYPFGYGLSYTTFAYSAVKTASENGFQLQVGVTNTGDVAGKHVVQVYAQSPTQGSEVHLVGFAKTDLLQPDATEAVTVELDWQTVKTLGNCYLTVASNAHEGVNNILCAMGHNAANTDGRMDHEGDMSLTFNLLQGAVADAAPAETQSVMIDMQFDDQDIKAYEGAQMPTTGAKNGLKLIALRGVPYEDMKWQQLLDQLSFEDMVSLLGDDFGWKKPAGSIQAPGVRDYQSSQCLIPAPETTDFASSKVMAATFNTELLYQVGSLMGNDCLATQMLYFYDPVGNCAQDEMLSAAVSQSLTKGVWEKGVIVSRQRESKANLLPCAEKELYSYRQDPQAVAAMREVCHQYLYALVNSAAMNGVGQDSQVQEVIPLVVMLIPAIAAGLWVLFIPVLILWCRSRKKWKKTPAYLNYRTMKKALKEEKRAR